MTIVNVGAISAPWGSRVPTKKKLRELCNADRRNVAFDQTSAIHSGRVPGVFTLSELPIGIVLNVVGPDPYTNRKWYAEVYINENLDKVVVK